MTTTREPILQPIPILSLRPTQMTVGMREVKEKRKRWRAHKSERKRAELLGKHMIPVVLGPDGKFYVVDHHHLARALHEEGVKDILVSVVADLSVVDKAAFWSVLDHFRWAYPYDAKGERRPFKEIPTSIADLTDDPYRSVAGEVRRAGGFAKDTTPFSEFLWADLFRRRLPRREVKADFARAVEKALEIARSKDAIYLPGWCGPVSDD
ncbi:ParB-like protein [Xanthomonas graminis]|uniref:Chromosome partitioning protein ParB n=1 Tax=Xanthomonas graminis pv. poae TaxID=227946 RepID=A0A199PAQ0_9XANT|nr:ParB-like protein [Xanthomonas translucens]OAX58008.1 chromosome partitioning protein ParB [Xanthomonas translucens pv. poae]